MFLKMRYCILSRFVTFLSNHSLRLSPCGEIHPPRQRELQRANKEKPLSPNGRRGGSPYPIYLFVPGILVSRDATVHRTVAPKRRGRFATGVWSSSNPFRVQTKNKPDTHWVSGLFGALEGIRTPDLLVRSQTLYPAELPAHLFYRALSIIPSLFRLSSGFAEKFWIFSVLLDFFRRLGYTFLVQKTDKGCRMAESGLCRNP